MVPYTRPPIIAIAIGFIISEPSPIPIADVNIASMVVIAVISIGRSLVRPASMIASCLLMIDVINEHDSIIYNEACQHDKAKH